MTNIDPGANAAGPEFLKGVQHDVNTLSDGAIEGDANNNMGEPESGRKVLHNTQQEDLGDWHLLDVSDGRDQTERSGSDSTDNSHTSMSSKVIITGDNQYIEVDQVNTRLGRHSEALIYICTAIYSLLPLASLVTFLVFISLLFTRFYIITVIYYTYLILDRKTCNKGGRRLNYVYRSKFWKYLAAYFPIKLRYSKNFKLNSNENYILAYHPHGISAFGAVTAFATTGLNFDELFPGIKARFMVHETSFLVPIMKEVFLSRGDCSVNSRSLDYILSQKAVNGEAGNLLTIVVGGLAEADLSDADKLKIVVVRRKGFVRKALKHGCNIIPCIAFGENSVFVKVNLKPGSIMHRLETAWYSIFKFKHPIYYGNSVFSSDLRGAMPYRRPITVVMGDPIKVDLVAEPSQDEVDKVHNLYLDKLNALFDSNSDLREKYDKCLELL